MSDNKTSFQTSELAKRILSQLKVDLGSVWTDRLTQSERELVESVSHDAAMVLLLGLAGPPGEAAREKAHVDAQLLNLTSVETSRVVRQFWISVAAAAKTALGVILACA